MLQCPGLLQSEQTKDGDRRTRSSEEAELWILWQYFIVWLLWSTDGHLVPHDTSPTITQIATIVHRAIVYRCNQLNTAKLIFDDSYKNSWWNGIFGEVSDWWSPGDLILTSPLTSLATGLGDNLDYLLLPTPSPEKIKSKFNAARLSTFRILICLDIWLM